jgi:hypothetical protein
MQFLDEQLHSRGNRYRNQRSDNPQPRRAQKDGDDGDTRGYLHGPADDFGRQQIIRLFDFGRAISMKSGLRPAVCGCSGIVSGGRSALGCGIRIRRA